MRDDRHAVVCGKARRCWGISFRHYEILLKSRARSEAGLWAQTHPRGIAEIIEVIDVGVGS